MSRPYNLYIQLEDRRMNLPELALSAWQDTYSTLHLWMQIVGKIRLAHSPYSNHWWQVPFYLTSRGLTTSPMPYADRFFDMDFDFIDHALMIRVSDGQTRAIPLAPRSVADFYAEVMATLRGVGIDVTIWTTPVEIANPTPFERDHHHASYDPLYVSRLWQIMLWSDHVLKQYRGRFIGKSSPSHFFWGSFDLAVTRFSGRRAPDNPNMDHIMREAYSHEVMSVGFWAGGTSWNGNFLDGAAFYAYAAPEPPGFAQRIVKPSSAFYSQTFGEFLLMYDDVRRADQPDAALLDFFDSTYDAAADLGGWDRLSFDR